MELSIFEPERQVTTTDMAEAMVLSQERFAVEVLPINPTSIVLNEEGTINTNLGESRMTSSGLKTLCKTLRIPDPFAGRIPFDLLQHNISRLCQGSDGMRMVKRADDGVVTGFLPSNKGVLSHEDLLNVVIKKMSDTGYNSSEFQFTDSQMLVSVLSDLDIEPKVGDISKIGQLITNPSIGLNYLSSRLFTHRLTCLNGAVMPKAMGSVRVRFNSEDSEESALLAFGRKVAKLSLQESSITMRYIKMSNERCPEQLWASAWGGVNRITGDNEESDSIFDVSEDRRNQIKHMAKLSSNPATVPADIQPLVTASCYEVFNQVTYGAHSMVSLSDKQKMWTVGGKFIEAVNKPNFGGSLN